MSQPVIPSETVIGRHLVSFRRAGPEDYESVLDINKDIYRGLDYIPALFHKWVRDPRRYFYLVEVDHEVAGLAMYAVVDAGKAAIGPAGRVHPKYRWTSIYDALMQRAQQDILQQCPNVEMIYYTALDSENLATKYLEDPLRHQLVLRMSTQFYEDSWTNFDRNRRKEVVGKSIESLPTARMLSSPEAIGLLNNSAAVERVFPDGYYIVLWEPLKAGIEDNNDLVVKRSNVVASGTQDDCQALSFGSYMQDLHAQRTGVRYDLSFYGSNINQLKSHLAMHLSMVKPLFKPQIFGLILHHPKSISEKAVEEYLQAAFGFRGESVQSGDLVFLQLRVKDLPQKPINSKL